MKKIILVFMALTLVSSMCFAAKRRVYINGKPKMLEISNVYEYDKFGNLLSDGENSFKYNDRGQPLEIKEDGLPYVYTYDSKGRLISKISEWNSYEYYSYDKNGNLCYVGDKPEEKKKYAWDYKLYKDGKLIHEQHGDTKTVDYTYNKNGDLLLVDYHIGYDNQHYQDVYEYNEKGLLVKTVFPGKAENDGYYHYDEYPSPYIVTYEYDDNGNLTYKEDLENGSILREYDENNHMIYEWKENNRGDQERFFEYDGKGNLITIREPREGEAYYDYQDDDGNVVTVSYEYEYDSEGNLISKSEYSYYYRYDSYYGEGQEKTLENQKKWDSKGRLLTDYDNGGINWEINSSRSSRHVGYEYDDKDRVIKIKVDDGEYMYEYVDNDNGGYTKYEYELYRTY